MKEPLNQDNIQHELHDVLRALQACANSKELAKNPNYLDFREEIERVVNAFAYKLESFPTTHDLVQPESQENFLRFFHWNIERGRQLPRIKSYLQEHPYVRQADVIILTETDIGMARSGNRHVAQELAELLGCSFVYANSYLCISKGTGDELLAQGDNAWGLHGITILSRLPILKWQAMPQPQFLDKISGHEKRLGTKRALFTLLQAPNGKPFGVVGVHLDAHSSPSQRRKQMHAILQQVDQTVGPHFPVVIGGDLNTTTYSVYDKRGLTYNAILHLLRGFRRTIELDYRFPQHFYEKLFRDLPHFGYEYDPWNLRGVGTLHYDNNDQHEQQRLAQHLPNIIIKIFEKKLQPWNGRVEMKLDWFMGRGFKALDATEGQSGTRHPLGPQVFSDIPIVGLNRISDHFPIGVDARLSDSIP